MGLVHKLIIFGIGVYSGVYINQNYEIKKIDSVKEMSMKFQDYIKQFEKPEIDRNHHNGNEKPEN